MIPHGWKSSKDTYFQAPRRDRLETCLAYIGLAALLAYGSRTLQEVLHSQHFRSQVALNVVDEKGR